MELTVIGHIKNGFTEKFGIPRQSGLVKIKSQIVFEPAFRDQNAFRGLDGYSHIWLLWDFSKAKTSGFTPMVRPPRLDGNTKMGVFATRSPFRPNSIGLSSVKLEEIEYTENGPILTVSGADLLDGTPIYDIKPYLPFTDSHPEAIFGFSQENLDNNLTVEFDNDVAYGLEESFIEELISILREDPRPSYQDDKNRIYGMKYSGYEVKFSVNGNILTVSSIRTCN